MENYLSNKEEFIVKMELDEQPLKNGIELINDYIRTEQRVPFEINKINYKRMVNSYCNHIQNPVSTSLPISKLIKYEGFILSSDTENFSYLFKFKKKKYELYSTLIRKIFKLFRKTGTTIEVTLKTGSNVEDLEIFLDIPKKVSKRKTNLFYDARKHCLDNDFIEKVITNIVLFVYYIIEYHNYHNLNSSYNFKRIKLTFSSERFKFDKDIQSKEKEKPENDYNHNL